LIFFPTILANFNHLPFRFNPFDSVGISSTFWPCRDWIKRGGSLNPVDILKKLNDRGIGLKSWGAFWEKLNEKEILSEIILHELCIQKVM
jgi:hypothetical protein